LEIVYLEIRYRGEVVCMKSKSFSDEGIRKIASGMKKATDKYGLPTKKKDVKNK